MTWSFQYLVKCRKMGNVVFWAFPISNTDEIQMFVLMQGYSSTSFPSLPGPTEALQNANAQ